MEEIWIDIKGYEGLYKVSNLGKIKSLDKQMMVYGFQKEPIKTIRKGKILKPRITRYGYEKVLLTKNNKSKNYFVHRLVAISFIENPNNYNEVNHIDGNKRNNNILNLEWCTHSQNMKHCFDNKLRKNNAKPMLGLTYENNPLSKKVYQYDLDMNFIKEWGSIREASESIGVDASNISKCCNGHAKTCKGFIWKTEQFKKELEEYRKGINND